MLCSIPCPPFKESFELQIFWLKFGVFFKYDEIEPKYLRNIYKILIVSYKKEKLVCMYNNQVFLPLEINLK